MSLIETFQDLIAHVPEFVQPLIVAAAGAVPFIEGEGAAAIGIIGGITPIVAAVAAIVGNFVCVAILVLVSSGARGAVVSRHRSKVQAREAVLVGADSGSAQVDASAAQTAGQPTAQPDDRKAARAAKFQRAFERYGVPGVSLLGPLLLPTQFTATMLAAAGIGKVRILAWQGVAIVGWTTVITLIITGVIRVVA